MAIAKGNVASSICTYSRSHVEVRSIEISKDFLQYWWAQSKVEWEV